VRSVYDGRVIPAVPNVTNNVVGAVPDVASRVVGTMGVVMDQGLGTTVGGLGDRVGGAAQVIRTVPQVCHRVICAMRGNGGTREARKQQGSGTSTQHQSHCGAQGQPLRLVALRHRHGLSLPA
jgi:hypothetical protein